MKNTRVAIALSGGVDSAVVAILLRQQGYELIGLNLLLIEPETLDARRNFNKNAGEIQQFCANLSIPLYIVEAYSEFKNYVINYFCQQYASGYTPNPCVACNQYIKFGLLLQKALFLGADYLATGHYARVNYADQRYQLLQGIDEQKDQSYVLYKLNQRQLSKILFPLGKYRKSEVIDIARHERLTAADKNSSQDICFFQGKYSDFLLKYVAPKEGDIIDTFGNIIGRHYGIFFYTVGQRCRLGIASNHRLYVVGIDSINNRIIVGREKEIYRDELWAKDVNWITGEPPRHMEGIKTRIRYKSDAVETHLKTEGKYIHIKFCEPQRSISPGQSVVFYRDHEVLGGGTIENSRP